MLQSFKIDQAQTFATCVLLSVEPRVGYKSDEQERTATGVPKWECQVVGGFRQYGKIVNEVLKVGVASAVDPGQSLPPFTPVELVGFEVGVMPKERTNRDTGQKEQIGISVWYRCEELRPIASTARTGENVRKLATAAGS